MKRKAFLIILTWIVLCLSTPLFSQLYENQKNSEDGHHHHHLSEEVSTADKVKLVTGKGDFIFSWDQKLTAAFPKEAIMFEPKMHGGFNEDPETGIVYRSEEHTSELQSQD